MILETIRNYSGKAIIEDFGTYEYEELINQVHLYINDLRKHVQENDVIIVKEDYSFRSISLVLALSEFPCIIVPIVFTTEDEYKSKKEACNANKIITLTNDSRINIASLDFVKDSDQSDYQYITEDGNSGILLFSSGTTGKPKVMVHNFKNIIENFTPPRKQKNLVFLLFLMFDHIGGLNTLLGCLNTGTTMVIPKDRKPSTIANLIEEHKVQVLPASPTFLSLMLMTEGVENMDFSSLKMITYGTERMPGALLERLNERMPFVKFLQTFGTSETGIIKTRSKNSSSLYFKIVDEEVDYRIEEGELYLKTKTSIKGYRGLKSDKFSKDGWFATGDLVDVDVDGYIKIIGRVNDIINVGGLKVFPSEVEGKINEVDGVIDSTVFSKQNAITGEMVCAKVLIAIDKDKELVKKSIKEYCSKTLEKYKRPVKLLFEDKINHTNRYKKKI